MTPVLRNTALYGFIGCAVAIALTAAAMPTSAQSRAPSLSLHAGAGRTSGRALGHIAGPANPNLASLHGVPGNGFDYRHSAAVGSATRIRRPNENRAGQSFLTPIFGYGLPYYYAVDMPLPYDNAVSDEAAPGAPLGAAVPDASQDQYSEAETPAPPMESTVPPTELGQLILVRRDGQVVMAVAFTTSDGRLTYITQDGLRRSFPVVELDSEATRQMNSVNGTSVALPD